MLVSLATKHLEIIKPKGVISGMALGWDQACALAAFNLQIPYACYIPFEEQDKTWPVQSKFRWASLRDGAKYEIVYGKKYDNELMKVRNQGIIDDSEKILANFNGYPYSGTADAIQRAHKKKLEVINVYSEWKELNGG